MKTAPRCATSWRRACWRSRPPCRRSSSTTRSARGCSTRSPSCPSTTPRAPSARSSTRMPLTMAARGRARPHADRSRRRQAARRRRGCSACCSRRATWRWTSRSSYLRQALASLQRQHPAHRDGRRRCRFLGVARAAARGWRAARAGVFYPGSSIGNFTPERGAAPCCARCARVAGAGGALLIGVDLRQGPGRCSSSPTTTRCGVTAAFNLQPAAPPERAARLRCAHRRLRARGAVQRSRAAASRCTCRRARR